MDRRGRRNHPAVLAWWLDPSLVALLLLPWTYFALMSREFFAPAWLQRRPVLYVGSHMVILPLIDLYATACEWRVAGMRAAHRAALVPPRQLCQRHRRRDRPQDACAGR